MLLKNWGFNIICCCIHCLLFRLRDEYTNILLPGVATVSLCFASNSAFSWQYYVLKNGMFINRESDLYKKTVMANNNNYIPIILQTLNFQSHIHWDSFASTVVYIWTPSFIITSESLLIDRDNTKADAIYRH